MAHAEAKRLLQAAQRHDAAQIDAQLHDDLRHHRVNSRDDARPSQQPHGRQKLNELRGVQVLFRENGDDSQGNDERRVGDFP